MKCNTSDTENVYLTDDTDNVISIDRFPFVIGRKKISEGTDLSLSDIPQVSGIHAVITLEHGKYFLTDQGSTNGTFAEKENCRLFSRETRITRTELSDESTFWIYRSKFTFHTDSRSSQTCIIGRGDAYETASTLLLSEDEPQKSDECEAFLEAENMKKEISSFPFHRTDFTLEKIKAENRFLYRIDTDGILEIEGDIISDSNDAEIFSGCHFSVNSKKYIFTVK
ncbi:MAG: FHA domain-containing protein [Oscillospiraceae bacterium]|nr:FHA domain-containing protein [Oscillospiraceae bacterium]